MDRVGANAFLQTMRLYYPRAIFVRTEEEITSKVDDYVKSFAKWDNDLVLQVLFDWHLEHNEAPSVADIIRECKIKEIESKPYTPFPEEEKPKVTYAENPWKKAQEALQRETRFRPGTKHGWLFFVLKEQGYKEYLKAREAAINAKNRRNEENRRLGLPEDNRATEAMFESPEEKEYYIRLVKEGQI